MFLFDITPFRTAQLFSHSYHMYALMFSFHSSTSSILSIFSSKAMSKLLNQLYLLCHSSLPSSILQCSLSPSLSLSLSLCFCKRCFYTSLLEIVTLCSSRPTSSPSPFRAALQHEIWEYPQGSETP